jgi:hypothetical protein
MVTKFIYIQRQESFFFFFIFSLDMILHSLLTKINTNMFWVIIIILHCYVLLLLR